MGIWQPKVLARYNGVSSMVLTGSAALGVSTGDAMEAMAQMASQLPAGIDFLVDRSVA